VNTEYFTYNIVIPARVSLDQPEQFASEVAQRLFPAQEKWAIKTSDAFVTLFFLSQQEAQAFEKAWLTEAVARHIFHAGACPRLAIQRHVTYPTGSQASVLPDVAMAPLTEYLRLGPKGGIGWDRECRSEVYAPGALRNSHKTDPRSEFTSRVESGWGNFEWNAATVFPKGSVKTMLWTRDFKYGCRNQTAMNLLQHRFLRGSRPTSPDDAALGDAYFVLNQTWKPFIDIVRTDSESAFDFRKAARPLFTGWWHAISIENGWRIFSDNLTELTVAKLTLSL
jgi:hypothetical protein